MLRNSETGYGWLARLFHWIAFVLLILLTLKGLSFEDMVKGPEKLAEIGNHKSMGTLFLLIIAIRLFWRFINTRPKALGDNAKMNRVSAIVSGLLYVFMFVQPISGILMSQAKGYAVNVFNAFTLPTISPQSESLAAIFSQVHHSAWMVIIALVTVHVLGAIKQHFVAKNDTLIRIFVQR